jgi:hypothetical protein
MPTYDPYGSDVKLLIGSTYYDGSTAPVLTEYSTSDFCVTKYTVDGYIEPTNVTSTYGRYFWNIGSSGNINFVYFGIGPTGSLSVLVNGSSLSPSVPIYLENNTEYHIELNVDGTNVWLYVNGILQNYANTSFIGACSGSILIYPNVVGSLVDYPSSRFIGYQHVFRFTKGINRHTGDNFIPPEYPFYDADSPKQLIIEDSSGTIIHTKSLEGLTTGTYKIPYSVDASTWVGKLKIYTTGMYPNLTKIMDVSCIGNDACDPYWDNVVLAMHMDGADNGTTFIDEKGKTITRYGNTVTKTGVKKFGTASAYFDGTGDYLTAPDNADFEFGSGDFTIEAWVYLTNYGVSEGGSAGAAVFSKGGSELIGARSLTMHIGGTPGVAWTHLGLRISPDGTLTNSVLITGSFSFALNNWYHIAATRNGNTVYLAVNGVVIQTGTFTGAMFDTTQPARIGQIVDEAYVTKFWFPGYIDDLRITKGIARYTENFTPPTKAFPNIKCLASPGTPIDCDPYWDNVVLVMLMDGEDGSTTFIDEKDHTVVTNGDPIISGNRLELSSAWNYLGSDGDSLELPIDPDFDLSGDYTVEFFAESKVSVYSGRHSLMSSGYYDGSTGTYVNNQLAINFYLGVLYISFRTNVTLSIPDVMPSTGVQVHIAVSVSDSVGRLFINGELRGTTGLLGAASPQLYPMQIGRWAMANIAEQNFGYWNGYIDDLRITNGIGRYIENFEIPAKGFECEPVTDICGVFGPTTWEASI